MHEDNTRIVRKIDDQIERACQKAKMMRVVVMQMAHIELWYIFGHEQSQVCWDSAFVWICVLTCGAHTTLTRAGANFDESIHELGV